MKSISTKINERIFRQNARFFIVLNDDLSNGQNNANSE